jgi:predicted TIM-barrel fold metal-dependent hydrolase
MISKTTAAVPEPLRVYAGSIIDIDSHESTPMNLWAEQFGSITDALSGAVSRSTLAATQVRRRDDTEINPETVWKKKSSEAPGSFDLERRVEVLDLMGVRRQMMFPGGMGLLALGLYASADDPTVFSTLGGDRRGYAKQLLDAYNDFCVRETRRGDRLRPVAILLGETPEDLCAEARRLISRGARAFWIPTGEPPGRRSPADPALDPLWDTLAAADAALLAHIGDQTRFLATHTWRNAPAFEGYKVGGEFSLDPWTISGLHLAAQNFVAILVLGGVFERHPGLRFGCCELGASWIGPLAAGLDMWNTNSRAFRTERCNAAAPARPSVRLRTAQRQDCAIRFRERWRLHRCPSTGGRLLLRQRLPPCRRRHCTDATLQRQSVQARSRREPQILRRERQVAVARLTRCVSHVCR